MKTAPVFKMFQLLVTVIILKFLFGYFFYYAFSFSAAGIGVGDASALSGNLKRLAKVTFSLAGLRQAGFPKVQLTLSSMLQARIEPTLWLRADGL